MKPTIRLLLIACCVALLCSCNSTRRIKTTSTNIVTDHRVSSSDSTGAKITVQKDDSKSVSGKTNQTLSENESDVIIEFESDSAAKVTKTTIEEKDGKTIITTEGSKPIGIKKRKKEKLQSNDSTYADSTKSAYAVFGEESKLQKSDDSEQIAIEENKRLELEKRRIWIGVLIFIFVTGGAAFIMYYLDRKYKRLKHEINATADQDEV